MHIQTGKIYFSLHYNILHEECLHIDAIITIINNNTDAHKIYLEHNNRTLPFHNKENCFIALRINKLYFGLS